MYDSITDEDALLPNGDSSTGSSRNRKKASTAQPSNLMINRIMVIIALAALVALSTCLNSFRNHTRLRMSVDEEKIHQLEMTIELQEKIIERFNESITNTDVLKKLSAMEKEWSDERDDLMKQLEQTKIEVATELNSTMTNLDQTVNMAKEEIHEQVDTVKKDFNEYVVHTEDQFSMENSFMVYQLAGTFTLLSCLISMWHMGSHMRKMNQPAIQRKILAILWMCPIYAVTSWLSLVFPDIAGYLAIIKDGYEAYIIYQFLSFCISVLGKGDRNKVVDLLSKQVDHLTPPFRLFPCCCKPHYEDDRALADAILTQCQAFTMQFVFWRPVTTIANFLLNKYQYYGLADNPHDYRAPQFYVTLIQNLSIFIAFAGLLKFYHAVDKDLEWCRPFAKFLCIKGVVFMTFWQGLALTILAETTDVGGNDADTWAESAQNFLICLEMLLFSIAHFYCFPVEEWQPGYQANFEKAKFGETLALNDFFTDLKLVMSSNYGSKKKKKHKLPSESTVAEGDEEEATGGARGHTSEVLTDKSSSAGSYDEAEEDPKHALVQAIVESVEEYEGDDDEPEVDEAQERIGRMLDEMLLLSPRNSSNETDEDEKSKRTKSIEVEGDDSERNKSVKVDGDEHSENSEERVIKDNRDIEEGQDEGDGATESTALLTGESSKELEKNLRPSIFTTIAEHMDREEKEEETEEKHQEEENEWTQIVE